MRIMLKALWTDIVEVIQEQNVVVVEQFHVRLVRHHTVVHVINVWFIVKVTYVLLVKVLEVGMRLVQIVVETEQ